VKKMAMFANNAQAAASVNAANNAARHGEHKKINVCGFVLL
jgi:hypothetical protein